MASPDLSEFDLVFSDEFDSGSLDTDVWATAPIWGPYVQTNLEEQYYADTAGLNAGFGYNPFEFSNDTLTIVATPVADSISAPAQPAQSELVWSDYPEYQYNANYDPANRGYLSGLISTVNSFNFTHGYLEMRAKVPPGQGLWPAFWLLTSKYVEAAPEIDIMEFLGQFPNEVNHTMHYFDIANNWQLVSTPTYKTQGPDYTADFHTYGLLWGPKAVAWYVDGQEVHRVTDQEFLISAQSMYVIINLAVGGNWPGSPDASTPFPARFEVDYVRAYQQRPAPQITPTVLAEDYQLMFEDNFDGSELDAQRWNTSYLWGPYFRINQEEQIYLDVLGRHANEPVNPFRVQNGTLSIEADRIDPVDLPEQPPLGDAEWLLYPSHQFNADYQNGWTPGYSSGVVTSYDAFKFVDGYVEFRARVPEGGGLWPALWLLNGYYVGPSPEIDIMELQGELPGVVHHSYHYLNNNGELQSSAETTTLPSGNYSDDFHTYGVEWHPGEINWYIDGQITRTLQGPEVSTQLMYLIMNLAVGGNFVGEVSSDFPRQLDIDYVRVYQLKYDIDALTVDSSELSPGVEDHGLYGFNFNGQFDHRDAVIMTFEGSGTDLELQLSGYDIDEADEVEVFLNGVSIGFLGVTSNDGLGGNQFLLTASQQQSGTNTLRFEQQNPGWRWGVSDLLLDNPQTGNLPELIRDELDESDYGFAFNGQFAHREGVDLRFQGESVDLQLSLTAFDIDVLDEVSVFLNGTLLGRLGRTANDSVATTLLMIPADQQLPGSNTLSFQQLVSGWRWGITDLLLTDYSGPSRPQLVVGTQHGGNYGYNFDGVFSNPLEADFEFTAQGDDLQLTLQGYDIDEADEVSVYLNSELLSHLDVGNNNALRRSRVRIPASDQLPGVNVLSFRQRVSGWRWGLTELHLSLDDAASAIPISIGTTEAGPYGFNVGGRFSERLQVLFSFQSPANQPLTLSLDGFDIDSNDEVTVRINDDIIGTLSTGANNSVAPSSLVIPASAQIDGNNTLRFEQKIDGWTWGVSNLLISNPP